MANRATENDPIVSNYPPLDEWLAKHSARRAWKLPAGPVSAPSMSVEGWLIGGQLFVIIVHANRGGWDLFTSCPENSAQISLADADKRLGQ